MTRDNNGVRSKITHDVGRGSINRGEGMAGREGEEGGLKPVGGEINYSKKEVDQSMQTGIYPSQGNFKPVEKGMGGIEIKGDEEHRDFFKDEH